jgi:hypothetical protein
MNNAKLVSVRLLGLINRHRQHFFGLQRRYLLVKVWLFCEHLLAAVVKFSQPLDYCHYILLLYQHLGRNAVSLSELHHTDLQAILKFCAWPQVAGHSHTVLALSFKELQQGLLVVVPLWQLLWCQFPGSDQTGLGLPI